MAFCDPGGEAPHGGCTARTALPLALLHFLAALSCSGKPPGIEEIPVSVQQVREGVIALSCLDVTVGAFATARGIVVVDTGRSPSLMRAIRRRIETELRRDDFAYVVNTHWHPDHTGGNQVFPEAIIVGHESCPEGIRQNPADALSPVAHEKRLLRETRERMAGLDPSGPEASVLAGVERARVLLLRDLERGYTPTPPQRTFGDRLRLDMGDATVDLIYAGRSHTESDILVHLLEKKVLFAGDFICSEGRFCFTLNAMVDAPRTISALDEVLEGEGGVEVAVAGHGEILNRESLLALRDRLREGYATVEVGRSAARLLERWIEEKGFDDALREYEESRGSERRSSVLSEEEFDILASRLIARGMVREAAEVLRIALADLPGSFLLHDALGGAYLKLGRTDLAITHYERSVDLMPHNRNAATVLEEIRGTRE